MKVVCIGAGRLAHQLMPALQQAGCTISQVYSRTYADAVHLTERLKNSLPVDQFAKIDATAGLYFLTVADDEIKGVAEKLQTHRIGNGIVIHCSGMMGLDAISPKRSAIFYPLQTFSEHYDVDWSYTPIIITSQQNDIVADLETLARKISLAVYRMTDEEKSQAHLAAVFANNFTNHMLTLAKEICVVNNIPFDILRPLIRTTIEKALSRGPEESQTGPAVRGDEKTIQKHLALLEDYPGMADVYKVITESIRHRL